MPDPHRRDVLKAAAVAGVGMLAGGLAQAQTQTTQPTSNSIPFLRQV
jgi:hypothetical protein